MIRMAAITAAGRYGMELKFRSGLFFAGGIRTVIGQRRRLRAYKDPALTAGRRRDEERKEE